MTSSEAAKQLGLTPEEAERWISFHRASSALSEAARGKALRRGPGTLVVVCVAALGGFAAQSALAATGVCPNGFPFCFASDTAARAEEVNHNFSQIKEWLEAKVGPVDAGIPSLSVTGALGGASGAFSGGVSAASATISGTISAGSVNVGGTLRAASIDAGSITVNTLIVQNTGDATFPSSSDFNPEVYQLTTLPSGITCSGATRGQIFVARPSNQTDQDALCFCGKYASAFEVWCFNP